MVLEVVAIEGSRRVQTYPLPWNATSTLAAATNAQYFYDYAAQDPINNYDLSGTATFAALPQLEGGGGGFWIAGFLALGAVAGDWLEYCHHSNCGYFQTSDNGTPKPNAKPDFNDPAQSPGSGWEWRGKGQKGSSEGSWYDPRTGESLHPDLDHGGPIGPHYDWKAPNGKTYRVFPDGRVEPK